VSNRAKVILWVLYLMALAAFCFVQRSTLFAWPAGIVTGNLLASAIWAPLAVIHLDNLARKHHAQHMAILHRHHKELMAQVVDSPVTGGGSTALAEVVTRSTFSRTAGGEPRGC
jgi:hypothetical protein